MRIGQNINRLAFSAPEQNFESFGRRRGVACQRQRPGVRQAASKTGKLELSTGRFILIRNRPFCSNGTLFSALGCKPSARSLAQDSCNARSPFGGGASFEKPGAGRGRRGKQMYDFCEKFCTMDLNGIPLPAAPSDAAGPIGACLPPDAPGQCKHRVPGHLRGTVTRSGFNK